MSNTDLSLEPKDLKQHRSSGSEPGDEHRWWFYEESGGLTVLHHVENDGRWVTSTVLIPWRTIRAALKRKDS